MFDIHTLAQGVFYKHASLGRMVFMLFPLLYSLSGRDISRVVCHGYYMTYRLIILSRILLIFIEMKFIHHHSCVIFIKKSKSICND